MARKPYRPAPTSDDLVFNAYRPAPSTGLPRADTKREAFFLAVIDDLLRRLLEKAPSEKKAIESQARYALIERLDRVFPLLVHQDGIEKALDYVRETLKNTALKAIQEAIDFDAIGLLQEYQAILQDVSLRTSYAKRQEWLSKEFNQSIAKKLATYNGSELAERILAQRHGESRSSIHKELAKASTWLQERRAIATHHQRPPKRRRI